MTAICECPCGCSADATGEHRSRGCVRQTCDACGGHIDAQEAERARADELVAFVADVVEHLTRRGPIDELTWRDDQRFTDEYGDPLTFVDSARALLAQVKP